MRTAGPATPAAVTALVLLVATAPALATAPAPLEQARSAAERTSFEGVLEVTWRDGDDLRSEQLTVQAAGGALMVRGATRVMATPGFERLLSHGGGGWEEMWLPTLAHAPRPDGEPKYTTTSSVDGPAVAGRRSRVVEILHGGRLLERIFLDADTGLLLERDQYDRDGAVVRTLAFKSIALNPTGPPPEPPKSQSNHAPEQVQPHRLASPAAAPEALDGGYQRMGIYRDGSVLHVLYSDGVYDLSLFQQQGRLRRSDLPPSGRRVTVGDATGWRYSWPGGQVVVWSAGGRVFTAVSDAPADQVVAAAGSLPRIPIRELSLLGKIRRASQALMEPLS